MTWIWNITAGEIWHSGSFVAKGYAGGNCGKNPEGVNNPNLTDEPNIGPLPTGKYKFGTPVPNGHLGPFAIPLIPDGGNQMFGRSSFYCHGDTTPAGNASEGCIILPRAIRNQIAASPDNDLEVIAG